MGNEVSVLGDVCVPILVLTSHFLDYFVAGNVLTVRGNLLMGATAQIVESVAQFLASLSTLLVGNYAG